MKKQLKTMFSRVAAFVLAAGMILSGTVMDAGLSQAKAKVKVSRIWVSNVKNNKLKLAEGKKFVLKTQVKVSPNSKKYRKVKYASSKKKVASVSSTGKITAKKGGTTVITATSKTDMRKKVKIKVTVTSRTVSVKSISLNKRSLELVPEDTYSLKASIKPSNASNKGVEWVTSNERVADVDDDGVVTAIGVGTAKITVISDEDSDVTATCTVTVKEDTSTDASNGANGSSQPPAQVPATKTPATETPATEIPGADNPGGDNPGADNPGGDNPGADNPGGDNPGADNPGGDNPGTDSPGADSPEQTKQPVQPHSIDLTDDGVVGWTNPSGIGEAMKSEDGIIFYGITFVDFEKYLQANDIRLSPNNEVRVTWYIANNSDGTRIDEYTEGEKQELAYAACAKRDDLNWWSSGSAHTPIEEMSAGETTAVSLAGLSEEDAAQIVGINLYFKELPEDTHIVISSIGIVEKSGSDIDSDEDFDEDDEEDFDEDSGEDTDIVREIDLSDGNVIGYTLAGQINPEAEKTNRGIEFLYGGKMVYVDFENYLARRNLDPSQYSKMKVTWYVADSNGAPIAMYPEKETPLWGHVSCAKRDGLNGFGEGVSDSWIRTSFISETTIVDLNKVAKEDAELVIGVNLQLEKMPYGYHIVITNLEFV